jgi:hypothetical protein
MFAAVDDVDGVGAGDVDIVDPGCADPPHAARPSAIATAAPTSNLRRITAMVSARLGHLLNRAQPVKDLGDRSTSTLGR